MYLTRLPGSFYRRPTLKVAKELLGCFLVRSIGSKTLIGRIVEVEAYLGSKDPASHSYKGQTKRNEMMFHEGGHLYVYFTYGMHFCANVVTEKQGIGHAVLLRAIEPIQGIDTMRRLRHLPPDVPDTAIANGPAKLCMALGITDKDNGKSLLSDGVWIGRKRGQKRERICSSVRIGIRVARERRWRFYIDGSPSVSRFTGTHPVS